MHIEALYIYPIKALRAQSLDTAQLTKHGFAYERRFMLLEPKHDAETNQTTYRNMHVGHDPAGTLFFPTLHQPSSPEAHDGTIDVVYKPPKDSSKSETTITIPLEPDTQDLEELQVTMHKSPTKAYRMPAKYTDWFTACFGYDVILAYLGSNHREVLMSTNRRPSTHPNSTATSQTTSWLSSLTTTATSLLPSILSPAQETPQPPSITFSDCAPYLIVSSASLTPLSARLPAPAEADITKFRPNIVVSGAPEPWDEDYWGSLQISSRSSSSQQQEEEESVIILHCAHNCGRCKSLNIDYATGAPGTGAEGRLLAVMQKDRRVDPGVKYSPVFGRYCFLGGERDEGRVVRVGDEVVVGERNGERTRFDWEGLATN
ncbi:hypothetical protein Q7P37_006518 [Cladosporium fusiforme]